MSATGDDQGDGAQGGRISLDPGTVFASRYRVEELLGAGSYGAVYRATQLELGREVALKILHPDLLQSTGTVKRFMREARLAQRLEHPNTVTLYDFGQTDDGLPFIAYQMLRGASLDEVIKRSGPMPVGRVARIASQVLKSLMEAHSRGIVHRDVKPDNIFLTDFKGEPDFVKVLDFGIAKPVAKNVDVAATALTAHGSFIGTPSYMSPEQVRGEDEVGPPSDLYALGLVMAELITGTVIVKRSSLIETFLIQASDSPIALPAAVLTSPLGGVIRRAVEKSLDSRYGDAQQMLDDLNEAMRNASPSQVGLVTPGATSQPASAALPTDGSGPTTYPRSVEGVMGRTLPSQDLVPTAQADAQEVVGTGAIQDRQRMLMFLVIGAGVFVIGLVAAVVIIAAVIVSDRADQPRHVMPSSHQVYGDPGSYGEPSSQGSEPVIPPAGDGTKLGALTTEVVRDRIQRAGWQVHYVSDFGGQGRGQGVTFIIRKGLGSGTVTLLLFGGGSLSAGSRVIGGNNSVVIEGQRALEVEVVPNGDPTIGPNEARTLITAITQ